MEFNFMDFLGLNRLKLKSKSCKAKICNHQLRKFLTHKIISFFDQLVNSLLYKYLFKKKVQATIMIIIYKGYFPPKIDIQTRISGVQHKTQNFTLISNLHTVFYLVAYFQRYITFSENCQKNDFFKNSKNFPLTSIF